MRQLKKQINRRDPVATKARLLESARLVFSEKGYEGSGLREICRNAGVDQALVKRYFGSKEALFREIFAVDSWLNQIGVERKDELGKAIADFWLGRPHDNAGFDATMALLKSVGSHQVNAQLREVVEDQHVDQLAKLIGGRNSKQRAALIISQIIEIDVSRRVLEVESMSHKHKNTIRDMWASQIQSLVDSAT